MANNNVFTLAMLNGTPKWSPRPRIKNYKMGEVLHFAGAGGQVQLRFAKTPFAEPSLTEPTPPFIYQSDGNNTLALTIGNVPDDDYDFDCDILTPSGGKGAKQPGDSIPVRN